MNSIKSRIREGIIQAEIEGFGLDKPTEGEIVDRRINIVTKMAGGALWLFEMFLS